MVCKICVEFGGSNYKIHQDRLMYKRNIKPEQCIMCSDRKTLIPVENCMSASNLLVSSFQQWFLDPPWFFSAPLLQKNVMQCVVIPAEHYAYVLSLLTIAETHRLYKAILSIKLSQKFIPFFLQSIELWEFKKPPNKVASLAQT